MKVMVLVKATKDSEAGIMPSQQLITEMGKFDEELAKAGVLRAGEGLQPSAKGVRVKFSGGDRTVTRGPFAATEELVAGFWIWEVSTLDEAIAWVKKCPNPHMGPGEIEIRPLFTAEDFGEAFTPDAREREARLREQLENRKAS